MVVRSGSWGMAPITQVQVQILALVLIGWFGCAVRGLTIHANTETVVPILTKDVQVMCQTERSDEGNAFTEFVLTISRPLNASKITAAPGQSPLIPGPGKPIPMGPPVPVAVLNASNPNQPIAFLNDISVYGHLGGEGHDSSFLLVVWKQASLSTSGIFQCHASFKPEGKVAQSVMSPTVTILDKLCSNSSYSFGYNRLTIHDFESTRISGRISLWHKLKGLIENKTTIIETHIDGWFHKLDKRLSMLVTSMKCRSRFDKNRSNWSEIEESTTAPRVVHWPAGRYGLLQPDVGCPTAEYGCQFEKGFFKHHTESSSSPFTNENELSKGNNFAKPVITSKGGNNYVFTRYCSKRKNTPGDENWPKGRYCINRVGGRCPPKFHPGYVMIDNEDTKCQQDMSTGPDGRPSRIYYCCRTDADVRRPMDLPTAEPFFLYRFRGQCQAVRGMHVTSQWFFLDTEHTNNNDLYQNTYHPDGQADAGVKIFVCYYTPIIPQAPTRPPASSTRSKAPKKPTRPKATSPQRKKIPIPTRKPIRPYPVLPKFPVRPKTIKTIQKMMAPKKMSSPH